MEINTSELANKIKNGEKVIVDFWAPWCGPCKVMKPNFEKVSKMLRESNSEVQLYTVNVDENREFAQSHGIRAIPTIKVFSDGKETMVKSGMMMESQITELANSLLHG